MDQVLQDVKSIAPTSACCFSPATAAAPSSRHVIGGIYFFQHLKYDLLHIYIQNTHPLAERKKRYTGGHPAIPVYFLRGVSPVLSPIHDDQEPVEPQQQIISVSDRAMAYSLLALGDAYVTGSGYLTQEGPPPLLGQCAHHGFGANRDRVYL